jgi:hypothetical protein
MRTEYYALLVAEKRWPFFAWHVEDPNSDYQISNPPSMCALFKALEKGSSSRREQREGGRPRQAQCATGWG